MIEDRERMLKDKKGSEMFWYLQREVVFSGPRHLHGKGEWAKQGARLCAGGGEKCTGKGPAPWAGRRRQKKKPTRKGQCEQGRLTLIRSLQNLKWKTTPPSAGLFWGGDTLPTTPNPWNAVAVARQTIKVHMHILQRLWEAWASAMCRRSVWVQEMHGPDLGIRFPQPMPTGAAIDLASQGKDNKNLFLFDVPLHRLTTPTYPSRHGISHNSMVWGTLEVRPQGRAGSEKSKFVQAC